MLKAALTLALAGLTLVPPQFSIISVSDEVAMGRDTQKQVKAKVPELSDATVRRYVSSLGRALAARVGGPAYPYSFSVANYREINAFALPGGPVWIHRGAIAAAGNEAQLAGVLAHEIAHISERHAAGQITKQLVANGFLGLLGAVLGSSGGATTAQAGARVLAGGYMLKFSREDEREADRVGARLARSAGWDARQMVNFMQTLQREQGRNPGAVEVFLSSHPAPAERVELLRDVVRGMRGGRVDSGEFQRIRRRLAALPPARAMPRR